MALAAVAGPWRCALRARRGPENKCAESALTASPSQLQPGGLPLPAEAFTCEPAASWPSVCLPDLCSKVWTDPDRSLSPSGKRSCSVPMGSARPGSSDGDPAGNSPVSLALGCAASQGMWERSALQRQLFLALLGGSSLCVLPQAEQQPCSGRQADLCFSASHLALDALRELFSHLCRYGSSPSVPPFKFM